MLYIAYMQVHDSHNTKHRLEIGSEVFLNVFRVYTQTVKSSSYVP